MAKLAASVVSSVLLMIIWHPGAYRRSSILAGAFTFVPSAVSPHHQPQHHHHRDRSLVRRFGLSEWRNQMDTTIAGTTLSPSAEATDREILLLPFRATEALVPGQSVSIVLKEGRYMDLFQDCIDDHCSILGMALLGEDAILEAMVLCEIDDFEVDAGFRGKVTVQVTLRAVGRATVREITQMKPVMVALGRELVDDEKQDPALLLEESSSATESTSETTTSNLLKDIQSTIQALGRQAEFEKACQLVRDHVAPSRPATSTDEDSGVTSDELAADVVSWAIFAMARDKSQVAEAIARTDVVERLQLGLQVLLGETFNMSGGGSETSLRAAQTDSDAAGCFE